MVRINKVSTKTGDEGKTTLAGGQKVTKSSLRIEAYGNVDELKQFVERVVIRCDKNIVEKTLVDEEINLSGDFLDPGQTVTSLDLQMAQMEKQFIII